MVDVPIRRGIAASVSLLLFANASAALAQGMPNTDWKTLDVAMIETGGIQMTSMMPGDTSVYRTGQAFTPANSIDCTNFTPAAAEYLQAIKQGAKVVKIEVSVSRPSPADEPPAKSDSRRTTARPAGKPSAPQPFYGVLAFCKIHKSAQGPAARTYSVQVPAAYLDKARDGFVSVVGEKVAVARYSWETPTQRRLGLGDLFRLNPNPGAQQQMAAVQEDFSWILWLTDRAPTFTEAIPASTPPAH